MNVLSSSLYPVVHFTPSYPTRFKADFQSVEFSERTEILLFAREMSL